MLKHKEKNFSTALLPSPFLKSDTWVNLTPKICIKDQRILAAHLPQMIDNDGKSTSEGIERELEIFYDTRASCLRTRRKRIFPLDTANDEFRESCSEL